MKKVLLRYKFSIAAVVIFVVIVLLKPELGSRMTGNLRRNVMEFFSVLPPIFILLGLLDVWVEKETMMKYMGENTGFFGSLLIFVMATAAAGPLFAAFPIVSMLLKKGVKLFNVFLFLGIWSAAKVTLMLYETANMGLKYMLTRFICNMIGVIIMSLLLTKTTSEEERNKMLEIANNM